MTTHHTLAARGQQPDRASKIAPVLAPALDRLTPGPGRAAAWIAALAVAAVVAAGFALRFETREMVLLEAISNWRVGSVQVVSRGVYALLEPPVAVALACVAALLLGVRHRSVRVTLWFGLSVGVSWLPIWVVKQLVDRARPHATLLAHPLTPTPHDMGYPSGHTAFMTVFVVMLVTVAARSRWRALVALLGALVVVAVAASVLLDGVHYPTDVAASLVWGLAVTPFITRWLARGVLRSR